jgi:acyl-coenzyme A synthetase/AMP-(fatty) acid ligase
VAVGGALTARLAPRAARAGGLLSEPAITGADDLAAVLFTSGSTGAPKGVCYTHGMFDAQVRLVRETYGIAPGEIDLPLLPIFALFNPALGMTTVVPELDPRRPAAADPALLVQAIRQENVTNSFGSPTLWRNLADHCRARDLTLPSMRRVLCAGAPVPPSLWADLGPVLPNGSIHSPYGATEALPVSSIGAAEARAEGPATLRGEGTCVGRPIIGNEVKIIALADRPLAGLVEAVELPPGAIGEIIVAGPSVTREYDALPAATAAAKIRDGSRVWHRLGDAGRLDAAGRLWFCGRIAERVETADGPLHTGQVEPLFNSHPAVRRSALIALPAAAGRPGAALVIEPADPVALKGTVARRRLARELVLFAQGHPFAARIRVFYFHPKFPVDVRHNAKIHRLALARWAIGAKGIHSEPKR